MGTLTKSNIVDEIVIKTALSRKEAVEATELFIEIIKSSLEKNESVSISGFGKWMPRDKNARCGRNPQTGETITINPRRVVTFSLSNVLKARLSRLLD
ncbi:MAG: integration host factor subunit alpha [Thermodesulfobacteriota bacterium]|nr:integration host factor subunit alpha [Thermodesulfobacteriota bacterium]